MNKDAAGGLQEPEEVLQRQSDQFAEVIAKAQADMQAQLDQFQQMVDAAKESLIPAKPKPEVKHLDGGLWFNEDATKMLVDTLDLLATQIDAMSKQP